MWTAENRRDGVTPRMAVPWRRRTVVLAWVTLALGLLLPPGLPAQPVAPPAVAVHAVRAIGMTVPDLERAVVFYTTVLAFEKVAEVEVTGADYDRLQGVFGIRMRVARLRLGEETIELTEYLAPRGRPAPADARSNDRWFQHIAIIVSDMDRAYAHLRAHNVEHVSPEPQRLPDWNPNAAGIEAFYFKAPAGESLNYGVEQERLNSVFGARLRITALRAPEGPGIELLEYEAPGGGRPMPDDERANDLVHWQTRLVVPDAARATEALVDAGAALVSPGAIRLNERTLGFGHAVMARDPDGHVLQLVEP